MISKNSFYSYSHNNSPIQTNDKNSAYITEAFSYQDIANSIIETQKKNDTIKNFLNKSNQVIN